MKKMFYRKRLKDGAQCVMARGFKDDTGDERAEMVLTVTMGSAKRATKREVDRFVNELNAVVSKRYGEPQEPHITDSGNMTLSESLK